MDLTEFVYLCLVNRISISISNVNFCLTIFQDCFRGSWEYRKLILHPPWHGKDAAYILYVFAVCMCGRVKFEWWNIDDESERWKEPFWFDPTFALVKHYRGICLIQFSRPNFDLIWTSFFFLKEFMCCLYFQLVNNFLCFLCQFSGAQTKVEVVHLFL